MKASACRRMMWKETIQLLPVGVAAIVGIVVLQVLVAYMSVNQVLGARIDLATLQSVGVKLALIFGGAVSATLFNREADRKTLGFLQSLPMGVGEFYVGKVVPVVGWIALLLVFGLASAHAVDSALVEGRSGSSGAGYQALFLTACIAAIVVILGITFSLTMKDLYTSLAATAITSFVLGATISYWDNIELKNRGVNWIAVSAAALPWLFLIFHKRLAERMLFRSCDGPLFVAASAFEKSPASPGLHRRLVWQQLLHVKRIAIAIFLIAGIGVVLLAIGGHDLDICLFAAVVGLPSLATILGAQTFAVDHSQSSFRFLADRGASPTVVWWSRTWVMVALFAVTIGLCSLFVAKESERFLTKANNDVNVIRLIVFGALIFPVLSFSVAQFFSQRLSSPVINLFCSFSVVALLISWVGLASLLGIPITISCLPLVVALFLATWLYMPNWLIGKRSIRYGWLTYAIPCVALMVCYVGASLYRVYEIPSPSFPTVANVNSSGLTVESPQQTATGPEQEAAVWTELVETQASPTDRFEVEWLSGEQPPFVRLKRQNVASLLREDQDLLTEVMNENKKLQFPYPDEVKGQRIPGQTLSLFLIGQARLREAQGLIGDAWPIYVRCFEVNDAMRVRATSSRWYAANDMERWALECLQIWALQANREQLETAVTFLANRLQRQTESEQVQVIFNTHYVNQRNIRDKSTQYLALHELSQDGGIPTEKLLLFEQQRLGRLVDCVAKLELDSIQPQKPGDFPWELRSLRAGHVTYWNYQSWKTGQQLNASPTNISGPINFHESGETLFRYRQAGHIHMKVLIALLESPEIELRDALRDALAELDLDVYVKVVPSVVNRQDEEVLQYADSWYDYGVSPSTWPCLLFADQPSSRTYYIRTPIPPCYEFSETQLRMKEISEREAVDFAGTLFDEPGSDVTDEDLDRLFGSGKSGSLDDD